MSNKKDEMLSRSEIKFMLDKAEYFKEVKVRYPDRTVIKIKNKEFIKGYVKALRDVLKK